MTKLALFVAVLLAGALPAASQTPVCDKTAALEAYAAALDQLDALAAQLELMTCPDAPPPPPPPTTWPDAASTGPAEGVTLVSCASGRLLTSKSGCIFNGPITIGADNITVTDSIINAAGYSYGISAYNGVPRAGTVLERVEVHNASSKCIYIVGGFTGSKLDLHHCEDGVYGDNYTVTDSWFHDNLTGGSRHPDGAQTPDVGNVTLRGNNFDFGPGMNSTVFVQSNFGLTSNVLIENNRLKGGTYALYVDQKLDHPCPTQVRIRGNTFVRGSFAFGLASIPCAGTAGWEWSGNVYDDGEPAVQP